MTPQRPASCSSRIADRWSAAGHKCEMPRCPLFRRFRGMDGRNADIAKPTLSPPNPGIRSRRARAASWHHFFLTSRRMNHNAIRPGMAAMVSIAGRCAVRLLAASKAANMRSRPVPVSRTPAGRRNSADIAIGVPSVARGKKKSPGPRHNGSAAPSTSISTSPLSTKKASSSRDACALARRRPAARSIPIARIGDRYRLPSPCKSASHRARRA